MARKMKPMDGNTAAAYISYAFTDVAAIFPITPSSNMAESVDEWAAEGKKNLFGQPVKVIEMQSEGGAAGAVHGSLQAGAMTTTYTASQGLLLMIPNMYKIAGELLPGVFHVSARAVGANAISIFGDHSDVMATRQTGFAQLAEGSVQEVMDLAAVAHLAAVEGRVPFLNFFDGFRTSHEIQKVEVLEYEELGKLLNMDAVNAFRRRALNPDHPVLRGTVQNPDIHFQQREVANKYWQAVPAIVEKYMGKISELTGRTYNLFNYYGHPEAERIIIAMGSVTGAIEEVVDHLNKQGEKVGLVKVHLFRPFSVEHLFKAIPQSVKKICVIDRTKELGSQHEPLYLDVKAAFYNSEHKPVIVGGRAGIGSKDVTPGQILAAFENLKLDNPKDCFTLGIVDDITNTSIPTATEIDTVPAGTTACKFWGLGADGTVGANKDSIKIIGDHTDMYAQAYFAYDSKKSGGVTVSHLRFGKQVIKAPYLVSSADFVACHNQSYVEKYDILAGLKPGGTFLLNCTWTSAELDANLPANIKNYLAKNNINFYIIDAIGVAKELGLGSRINTIMQAAFFKIANIIPVDDAVKYMKQAVVDSYGNKGEKIVNMNYAAIDAGVDKAVPVQIPAAWATATDTPAPAAQVPEFIEKILIPMTKQEGDNLPVSTFIGMEDGTFPLGTSAYERRGIAVDVPKWLPDKCIQCNQCAYVCPHAAIRPILLTDAEVQAAPAALEHKPAVGIKDLHFTMAISQLDCTGCGNCAQVCPAKEKALVMTPIAEEVSKMNLWDYTLNLKPKANPLNKNTVKGSQFEKPLLEFSAACTGCGESPYMKLVTQLFGERMMIANATGCTSVWAGSPPSIPYTVNDRGHGPAWGNSLFEDNAEYGLGMFLGANAIKAQNTADIETLVAQAISPELKAACTEWLEGKDQAEGTRARADKLIAELEKAQDNQLAAKILTNKDYLIKRSQWIFGGDGWAYDIGYGGLDHILASGEDVNILVLDTEVYSNTGGQSSKSTPTAAIAKFAAAGKRTKKKDLGMIATTYGDVYVAQIAMGADKNQTIKAISEAESYKGVSIIVAYAPCINHGLVAGMGCAQLEAKRAVESGYWGLYRHDPRLKAQGKNPFTMDSKEPTMDFNEFLMGEVRYASLYRQNPEIATELFEKTKADAFERLENYKRLAKG